MKKEEITIGNKLKVDSKGSTKRQKKNFVLDTNIILYDPYCIFKFGKNNVIIPMPLLEELDKFKKGNEDKNFNAREFTRSLKKLTNNHLFNGGVSLGKGLGNLRVALGADYSENMEKSFFADSPDHRILAICLDLQKQGDNIVLVSNDTNLQIKALAFGIMAEEYEAGSVKDINIIYDAVKRLDIKDLEDAQSNNFSAPIFENAPLNQYFIFGQEKECGKNTLYRKKSEGMKEILFHKNTNISMISPKNDEQTLLMDALLDPKIEIIAITGESGTGKTLLSLAAALHQEKKYEKVLVTRPFVQVGADLGFLPGDIKDKISPYMVHLFDNLSFIKNEMIKNNGDWIEERKNGKSLEVWCQEKNIELFATQYIRGRSLSNCWIIGDEFQNSEPHEVKTLISRVSKGSKIIIMGDIKQIDSPHLNERNNGLSHLIERFKGQEEFVHIDLKENHRSSLSRKATRLL